ncbi:DUF3343 domain-containing protein [Companilactobacillus sp.]|jgi:hypothetical protein|uniref:DUF3343 domain-containing protein n=1 Tax=Companilactobacillus sp. TaxID=2767905 RepID=UPI0025B86D1D|nr:DUF3343 domain-containing protein [Companilactobacillus sp.]MCH4010142.1 DUF3343 domain-containing protein [Companilactobacillus sp.]MCH4052182.1 DUF3343 domain-containing protein [Companilactobacillus sp.]MCH4078084.1 DUF3343 domain-containing protein [Companilactobacillus sp.]MCH4126660.1 DUF3343 domain-containing protein [Companilactobacillus sp.]MCH4132245.1 DUF3343 domain-containing protein [Companilactobacillus sp.]
MAQIFGLMTFNTTHEAIEIKELLRQYPEYTTSIISTPGSISAGCGMSVRFNYEKKADILKLLSDKGLDYQKIYKGTRVGVKSTYAIDQ